LDAIGGVLAGVGLAPAGEEGRIPRLIAMLSRTKEEIAVWCEGQRNEDRAAAARLVCSVADHTMTLAETALTAARDQTSDMASLLRTWAADREPVIQLAMRPEWLLDGWEQICLVWNEARDDAGRCAALVEMIEQLPIPPREQRTGGDGLRDLDDLFLMRRPISLNEDWRTGAAVFDMIARNERFRAIAS